MNAVQPEPKPINIMSTEPERFYATQSSWAPKLVQLCQIRLNKPLPEVTWITPAGSFLRECLPLRQKRKVLLRT
jgi:hypothetical protein